MAQEALTIIRPGYAYNQIVWPGPTVTAVAAAAALTHAAYDSGYFLLKQKAGIPFNGMYLVVSIPGPLSSTGATGSCTLTFTVTFSNDGSTVAGYSHVLAPINFTFASSVGTITNTNGQGVATGTGGTTAYWRLPETRHAYIRVQAATALTTITGANYGLVNIAVQDEVDTEANNAIDLG